MSSTTDAIIAITNSINVLGPIVGEITGAIIADRKKRGEDTTRLEDLLRQFQSQQAAIANVSAAWRAKHLQDGQ